MCPHRPAIWAGVSGHLSLNMCLWQGLLPLRPKPAWHASLSSHAVLGLRLGGWGVRDKMPYMETAQLTGSTESQPGIHVHRWEEVPAWVTVSPS
jgi:hypothetical protein